MVSYTRPLQVERDTMTLEEIAQRLGISKTTAYELAQHNQLPVPVMRVGRRYLFSRHTYGFVLGTPTADFDRPEINEVSDDH